MCKISVQTSSPEDRLWMLTREVLWEMLFCPICRTSLNSKALEGTGSGWAVEVSAAGETKLSAVPGGHGAVKTRREMGHLTPGPRSVPSSPAVQFTHGKDISPIQHRRLPSLSTKVLLHLPVRHLAGSLVEREPKKEEQAACFLPWLPSVLHDGPDQKENGPLL